MQAKSPEWYPRKEMMEFSKGNTSRGAMLSVSESILRAEPLGFSEIGFQDEK